MFQIKKVICDENIVDFPLFQNKKQKFDDYQTDFHRPKLKNKSKENIANLFYLQIMKNWRGRDRRKRFEEAGQSQTQTDIVGGAERDTNVNVSLIDVNGQRCRGKVRHKKKQLVWQRQTQTGRASGAKLTQMDRVGWKRIDTNGRYLQRTDIGGYRQTQMVIVGGLRDANSQMWYHRDRHKWTDLVWPRQRQTVVGGGTEIGTNVEICRGRHM